MILNVIEKSRRQSAIESVNGLLDAGDKYQLSHMIDNKEYSTTIDLTSDTLKHKGAKPESGTLVISNKGKMSIIAKYGTYCIAKTFDEKSLKKLEREKNDYFREWIIEEWKHHNTVDPIYQLRIIKPEELNFEENEEAYAIKP